MNRMIKNAIDFSEVIEIKDAENTNDTFYLDVLTNNQVEPLYKLKFEIDLYFFEELQFARKELKDKEYFTNELNNIIKYIDDMNLASGKELNTHDLIAQKNEILAMLNFDFILNSDIRRIQKIITNMTAGDKFINSKLLKAVKTEILNQFPKIENSIKIIKHYKIKDNKALPVPMENRISLKRPKPGNNIYLSVSKQNSRRVYNGYKIGPNIGKGHEFIFVKTNKKWVIQSSRMIWIS